jgi:hypothetical protein
MAKLTFFRKDLNKAGKLPGVCCLCGEETDYYKYRKFSWCPSWVILLIFVGLLIWIIVAAVLTKRMEAYMPVCAKHKGHWFRRGTLPLLVLLFGVAVFFVGIAIVGSPPDPTTGQILMGAGGGIFFLSLFWAAIAQYGMLKPREITDREMTLGCLHPEFVLAVERQWQEDEAEEERDRAERRATRRSDEDR